MMCCCLIFLHLFREITRPTLSGKNSVLSLILGRPQSWVSLHRLETSQVSLFSYTAPSMIFEFYLIYPRHEWERPECQDQFTCFIRHQEHPEHHALLVDSQGVPGANTFGLHLRWTGLRQTVWWHKWSSEALKRSLCRLWRLWNFASSILHNVSRFHVESCPFFWSRCTASIRWVSPVVSRSAATVPRFTLVHYLPLIRSQFHGM